MDYNPGFLWSGISLSIWAFLELKLNWDKNLTQRIQAELVESPSTVLIKNNEKPVHVTGLLMMESANSLKDSIFGINQLAIRLYRDVEMNQWHRLSGNSFGLSWDSKVINSQSFPKEYYNPTWKYFSTVIKAKGPYKISEFKVDDRVIDKIKTRYHLYPEEPHPDFLDNLKRRGYRVTRDAQYYYLSKRKRKFINTLGDYRIKYQYIPSGIPLSVIGKQSNDRIVPYQGVLLVEEGKQSAESMLSKHEVDISNYLLLTRVLCFSSLGFGIYLGLFSK